MNILKKSLFVLPIIFLTSCLSVRYVYDHPEDLQKSTYRTYELEEHCLEVDMQISPINQQRIENAININLRDLGMVRSDNAELQVRYFVNHETKFYGQGCDDEYDKWEGGQLCVERISSYQLGTLVIDVIDQKQNLAIWHGAAIGPTYYDMGNADVQISKIVNQLFKNFEDQVEVKIMAD